MNSSFFICHRPQSSFLLVVLYVIKPLFRLFIFISNWVVTRRQSNMVPEVTANDLHISEEVFLPYATAVKSSPTHQEADSKHHRCVTCSLNTGLLQLHAVRPA